MGFYANSATAASNTTVNSIASEGGSNPGLIDNLVRELAAQGKQFALDMGGANTVGGSADAVTITPASGSPVAYFDGLLIAFVAASDTATTTPTANVSSLGAKVIKKAVAGVETAVAAGDIQAGGIYMLRYRSAWAAAAGAWQMLDFNISESHTHTVSQISDGSDLVDFVAKWVAASAAGASSLDFAEDTDNGTHKITLIAPASVTADAIVILPGAAGTLATIAGTETLTNKTLTDPTITGTILEDIFTITDGAAFEIDPGNGSIQKITLGANRTPAATNFANGESIVLMIADGTAYTITWTTVGVVWVGGVAPTLATSGFTHLVLWKENSIIRGKHIGDTAT